MRVAMPRAPSGVERARLQAIRSVDLEDARPTFDRIARTAQRLANTPIAHVSLVEADQLWITGVSDVELPPVAREHAFANLAIEGDAVLWIEDAAADRRFDDNPFVHGESALRFYAGAPIRLSSGSRVGSLSVLGREPRTYDAELAAALEDLAALVADEWERRRALKNLAASEADARAAHRMLTGVVDNAPVALVMTDRKMRVLQSSPRWREDLGVEGQALTGRSIYDIFPGSKERWGAFFDRALTGRTIRSDKAQLNLPNGRKPWVRTELTPWRNHRGRIGGLMMMNHDISDMVEGLELVRRSEQTLRLALEIGQISMWELDHGRQEVNGFTPSLTGSYRANDYGWMSENIWDAVHPADRPAAMAEWDRHERDGAPFRATYRLMRSEGPHMWVESAAELIRGEDGAPERVVGVLRNIDKEKRAELTLAKAKDAAEAANRAKSEFLANMSHEIRTPLNGVMGVASALSRTALSAPQREMVGLIESSAQTLESLLSDVLDLARVESGRLVLAHEPFELGRCLTDVGALFQRAAEAKNLDLIVEPAPAIDGVFLGDAARIRQILSNLVANAVKFTSSGVVRLGATALRTPEGIDANIWVKDTGIGFDDETKARLFERFQQADGSITRRYGGTGLGLAISRSLAEQMGGVLTAEASPGRGATFTLAVPLSRATGSSANWTAPAEPEPLATATAERAPVKVLLAEDHPTNRRVVQLILEAAGVELTCVQNGLEAVEACRAADFDLVLMDMQMPVMDGLTAIGEIRGREAALGAPRTRVYALTANAMPEHAAASKAAGADGHLTKPITADALFAAVDAAAEARARREEPGRLQESLTLSR